jgi:hypothetical protein
MFRRLAMAAALMLMAALVSASAQDKSKEDQAKAVGPLPTHPLDSAFARGNDANSMTNGLLNNDQFKRAVQAAAKAKRERLAAIRQNPDMVGPTPDQAARQAFLDTLNSTSEMIGAPKGK